MVLIAGTGCRASLQKSLIFEKTIALPEGRFRGPATIQIPRMADDSKRKFEIQTVLRAACGPKLRVGYPDGEDRLTGDDDSAWQALLEARAEAGVGEIEAVTMAEGHMALEDERTTLPVSDQRIAEPVINEAADASAPQPVSSPSAALHAAAPPRPGHWESTYQETWPGQLEYSMRRTKRCQSVQVFRSSYIMGFDESGEVTLWADVPQDVAQAQVTVRVFELADLEKEAKVARKAREKEQKQKQKALRAEQRAEQSNQRRVERSINRPPKPAPKRERPKPAKAKGAEWVSGYWVYSEVKSKGMWRWVKGYWGRPSNEPALKREAHGPPPVAGCTWATGHWIWKSKAGAWRWVDGYWKAPPPKQEDKGPQPVPESPWVAGRWVRIDASFRWVAGYWGRPRRRVEEIPPLPESGAKWSPGLWYQRSGQWQWMPGSYTLSGRVPPAPKVETPGPSPHPDAIWLDGFWKWSTVRSDHLWVAGYWESPPGEGYVWVDDPMLHGARQGHWELRIEIDARVRTR